MKQPNRALKSIIQEPQQSEHTNNPRPYERVRRLKKVVSWIFVGAGVGFGAGVGEHTAHDNITHSSPGEYTVTHDNDSDIIIKKATGRQPITNCWPKIRKEP